MSSHLLRKLPSKTSFFLHILPVPMFSIFSNDNILLEMATMSNNGFLQIPILSKKRNRFFEQDNFIP